MSIIYGNPIIANGGGGASLNIDYGSTPPTDTSKLWVPLAAKPDAVECSPVMNYGSEYIETIQNTGSSLYSYYCTSAVVGDELYFFGVPNTFGGVSSQVGYGVYNMRTNNLRWELWSSLSGTSVSSLYGFSCVSYGTDIYICGSSSGGNLYKFDTVNKSISRIGLFPNENSTGLYMAAAAIYKGIIYVFGGGSYSYANRINKIQYYDIASNTFGTKNATVASTMGASAQTIGKYIYIIGGSPSSGSVTNAIYRYSPDDDEIPTKVATLPTDKAFFNSVVIGNFIYTFGGTSFLSSGSGFVPTNVTSGIENQIFKFNVTTNEITTVSASLLQPMCCPVGLYDSKVYILNITSLSSRTVNIIQDFVSTSPLTSNHLLLQEDYGCDFLWSAIKSKDTDLKVKVINAYLGDSNNIAQPTNAYLYDTTTNQWKSLSGESYVADMQMALNILGVT